MSSNVEFDSDSRSGGYGGTSYGLAGKPASGITGFLIKKGIARSKMSANIIMAAVLIICLGATYAILAGSGGFFTGNSSDEILKKNQAELQAYRNAHPNGI